MNPAAYPGAPAEATPAEIADALRGIAEGNAWGGSFAALQAIADAARLALLPGDELGDDADELAHRFDLPSHALNADAARAAEVVARLWDGWQQLGASAAHMLAGLEAFALRHHVELPQVGTKEEPTAEKLHKVANRLRSPLWWRRALRKRFRKVEEAAIAAGEVHMHASPYVSARGLKRAQEDKKRMAEMLASMEAINDTTGEVLALADVVEASLANPANRRRALAVRIKGVEQHANDSGLVGLFLTLTCPSRMHSSKRQKYAGTTPRQGNAYLCRVWANAMRKARHEGMAPMGLRVVEPHQDACPHWHILAFVRPEQADAFTQTVRAYALKDTPDEAGADEHRFTVEKIDPAKGGALAYVMKYVSKSIDGEGVGEDTETGMTGSDAARSVVAWARLHGIRQFQFFGLPPVTPVRELYRVTAEALPDSPPLREAHAFIKANEQGALLALLACACLTLKGDYTDRPSTRYPGEAARCLVGVRAMGADLGDVAHITTRNPGEWRIQLKHPGQADGLCTPWTRFNNSASGAAGQPGPAPSAPAPASPLALFAGGAGVLIAPTTPAPDTQTPYH